MTTLAERPPPAVWAWTTVCLLRELLPERGVAALVGGEPVAVFRTHDGEVLAVGNVDPFSGASVMSRGIVGTRGDTPTVASPVYKQVFDLRSGRCLDTEGVALATYGVRVLGGVVQVGRAS